MMWHARKQAREKVREMIAGRDRAVQWIREEGLHDANLFHEKERMRLALRFLRTLADRTVEVVE